MAKTDLEKAERDTAVFQNGSTVSAGPKPVASLKEFALESVPGFRTKQDCGVPEPGKRSRMEKVQLLLQHSSGKSKAALEELSPLERMQMLAQLGKPNAVKTEEPPPLAMRHISWRAEEVLNRTNSTHASPRGGSSAGLEEELSPLERMKMLIELSKSKAVQQVPPYSIER